MANQQISTGTFGVAKFVVSPDPAQGTHTTIAAAVASASSGDSIYILPATYTEDISFTVPLTLFAPASVFRAGPNVIIVGQLSISASDVRVGVYGIQIITNSAPAISLTGVGNSAITLSNCSLSATNANAIFATGDSTSNVYFVDGYAFISSGFSLFTTTNANVWFQKSFIEADPDAAASTVSASLVRMASTNMQNIIETTGNGSVSAIQCSLGISTGTEPNITFLTTSGTGVSYIYESVLGSGTASCISVGSGTQVFAASNVVTSSNTNVFTGAGIINTGGNVCTNSSGNNVSTINHLTVI